MKDEGGLKTLRSPDWLVSNKRLERVMVYTLAGFIALGGVVSQSVVAAVMSFGLAFHLLLTLALSSILYR